MLTAMDPAAPKNLMKVAIAQALTAQINAARNAYSHPTAHYQSKRRRNRDFPSRRGTLKRFERDFCEAQVRKDREREEAWHLGEGPKPAWLHSKSRQRYV